MGIYNLFKYFILLFPSIFIFAQKPDAITIDSVIYKLYNNKDIEFTIASNGNNSQLKQTVFFLQGSNPRPLFIEDQEEYFFTMPFQINKLLDDYNFVFISHPGIPIKEKLNNLKDNGLVLDEDLFPPKQFIKQNTAKIQFNRVSKVYNYLRKKRILSKKVYLFGHSQGGRIATLFSPNKKFSKIAIASFNPLTRFHEKINKLRFKNLTNELNNKNTQNKINTIYKEYKALLNNKKDYSTYSYTQPYTIQSILKAKVPLLYIYGTYDIGSVFEADKLQLHAIEKNNDNILIKPYYNLEHNFFYRDSINMPIDYTNSYFQKVFDETMIWFKQ